MPDETLESERRSHKLRTTDVAVLIALLIQLAGLIWGAATLSASVRNQQTVVQDVREIVRELARNVTGLQVHDAQQDGKIDGLEQREIQKRP